MARASRASCARRLYDVGVGAIVAPTRTSESWPIMVSLPAPRSPLLATSSGPACAIRRLSPGDERALVALLLARPADNALLLGQIARGALAEEAIAGPVLGWFEDERLTAAACIGSNLVPSHDVSEAAAQAFARFARESPWLIRVVVGPDAAVARLLTALALPEHAFALVRSGQVLLEVDRRRLDRGARSVELRPAQPHELDHLMAIDLAMAREELGIDPFSSDIVGFRKGWERRIQEWRAWVTGPVGGPIHFKVDQAAVSDHGVQLAGVYTAPSHRRRGLAHRAIGEMCHLLLREVPRVNLYVNADNEAALGLYRGLGFYEVGRVGTAWLRT